LLRSFLTANSLSGVVKSQTVAQVLPTLAGEIMSIWSSLRGHAEQQEMFRRTIRRRRLSQAYLFVGPAGIGKQQFARRLAQSLLCQQHDDDPLDACGECSGCKPFLAGAHPDFLSVGCPEGKRELPIALLVGSEERRGQEGLCHDLSLGPLPGSRKVAIVDDADTMNEASANSFLKTLEEPPDRAVLLLIASNLDALLPTIRSRCQMVRFSPLDPQDLEALLIEQDLVQSNDDARFASALSEGSLSVARQLLEPELRILRTRLYSQLGQAKFGGLALSRQLMEGLGKISSETAEQRRNGQWLIRFTVEFFRAVLWTLNGPESATRLSIPEAAPFASRLASQPDCLELVGSLIDRTIDASGHVDQNVGVALCLDALFEDLARMVRPPTAAH
jgi:DNA polymerase-3 subunit delta'